MVDVKVVRGLMMVFDGKHGVFSSRWYFKGRMCRHLRDVLESEEKIVEDVFGGALLDFLKYDDVLDQVGSSDEGSSSLVSPFFSGEGCGGKGSSDDAQGSVCFGGKKVMVLGA